MTLPTSSKVWLLSRPVEGSVKVEGPDAHFTLATRPVPSSLNPDEILVQMLALSNDPVQLLVLRTNTKDAPIPSYGIGRVLAVGASVTKAKVGDLVYDNLAWAEYFAYQPTQYMAIVNGGRPLEFPLSAYLGILGLSGFTAYAGLRSVLDFKPGQSIIVSGAAGSVGHVVVQYAKYILHASKVIAIAGSDEKCAWLEKHGADVAVNYKSPEFNGKLHEAVGPEGADAFFDNVYGPVYDAALSCMKNYGKVAICGAIAQYNSSTPRSNVDTHMILMFKHLTLVAFTCADYMKDFPAFLREMGDAIKAGTISAGEGTETVVDLKGRFEEIPKTWERLFRGANNGKLVSIVAE